MGPTLCLSFHHPSFSSCASISAHVSPSPLTHGTAPVPHFPLFLISLPSPIVAPMPQFPPRLSPVPAGVHAEPALAGPRGHAQAVLGLPEPAPAALQRHRAPDLLRRLGVHQRALPAEVGDRTGAVGACGGSGLGHVSPGAPRAVGAVAAGLWGTRDLAGDTWGSAGIRGVLGDTGRGGGLAAQGGGPTAGAGVGAVGPQLWVLLLPAEVGEDTRRVWGNTGTGGGAGGLSAQVDLLWSPWTPRRRSCGPTGFGGAAGC